MNEYGFITVERNFLDHPVVGAKKPYCRTVAWLWLRMAAAWKPRRVAVTNGRYEEVITLQRGQLSHSQSFMAKGWGWSEKKVRTYLSRLENDGLIALQTDGPQTVITICDYDKYQMSISELDGQTDGQTDGQRARKGREEEQFNNINKDIVQLAQVRPQRGNSKKADDTEPLFLEFYSAYPRHQSKQDAVKAYNQVRRSGVHHEIIMQGLERAKRQDSRFREAKFTPLPASWLRAGGYEDEPSAQTNDWKMAVFS